LRYHGKQERGGRLRFIYQSPDCAGCAHRRQCCPTAKHGRSIIRTELSPAVALFKSKMETEEAKKIGKALGIDWRKFDGLHTVFESAKFNKNQLENKVFEGMKNFYSKREIIKSLLKRKFVNGFVKWLTSPQKGQRIIRDFGKDKYGSPLFFPNSKEWRGSQGQKNNFF
jgi:hypothetical protein